MSRQLFPSTPTRALWLVCIVCPCAGARWQIVSPKPPPSLLPPATPTQTGHASDLLPRLPRRPVYGLGTGSTLWHPALGRYLLRGRAALPPSGLHGAMLSAHWG